MTTRRPSKGSNRLRATPATNRADLLSELAARHATRPRAAGDITAAEYAAQYGVPYVTARYRLNALVDAGVLERVARVEVEPGARPQTVWRLRE